jgi:hypothetical protein
MKTDSAYPSMAYVSPNNKIIISKKWVDGYNAHRVPDAPEHYATFNKWRIEDAQKAEDRLTEINRVYNANR